MLEAVRARGDVLHEPALEARRLQLFRHATHPRVAMFVHELVAALAELRGLALRELALELDELAARIAAVAERVGVDEPRRVVLRIREDRLEELLLVRH